MNRRLLVTILISAMMGGLLSARAQWSNFMAATAVAGVSNPIASTRISPYWSTAGATITAHATKCGSTIVAYGTSGSPSSSKTINDAIQACTADGNHYVELGAGTFYLSDMISWTEGSADANHIVLRGAGANSTFLIFKGAGVGSGGGACGQEVAICIEPWPSGDASAPQVTADWTAGYAQGTTTITLNNLVSGATAAPFIGQEIGLDQLSDRAASITDNGGYWTCGGDVGSYNVCCDTGSCNTNAARSSRGQIFWTTVTSVSGSGSGPYTVGLADPLIAPNYNHAGGVSPGAWWSDYGAVAMNDIGIENLSIDTTAADPGGIVHGIRIANSNNVWLKNVRMLTLSGGERALVGLQQTSHVAIVDSYLYGKSGSNGNYGVESFGATNSLIENNIVWCTEFATDNTMGAVYAYNYARNNCYVNPNWMQPTNYLHSSGNQFQLYEGEDTTGLIEDHIHGPAFFITAFRNRFTGWQNGNYTGNTNSVEDSAFSRYSNLVGNVLGTTGFHTLYESAVGGSATNCVQGVYSIGWSGNCASGPFDDANVKAGLLRWGNYDTVNAASRFNSGEVPSSDTYFPNTVPSNNNLPASIFLNAQPAFWATAYGTPTWPAIGPDVTGSDATGRVNSIPAKLCFENSALDTNYATAYAITGGSYNATGVNGTYPLLTLTIGTNSVTAGGSVTLSGMNPSSLNGSYLVYSEDATHIAIGFLSNPNFVSGGSASYPDVRQFDGHVCYPSV